MENIVEQAIYLMALIAIIVSVVVLLLGMTDTVKDWIVGKNRK